MAVFVFSAESMAPPRSACCNSCPTVRLEPVAALLASRLLAGVAEYFLEIFEVEADFFLLLFLAVVFGACFLEDVFDFFVDNSAGANTVTVAVNTGITVNTPAITGGATLTVSTANAVGQFRLVFTSATAAKLLRIA